MIVVCRSPKGGSGTTITSAALAMMLAAQHRGGGYIVDLVGELAPALGIPDPPDTQPVDVNASLKLLSFAPREFRTTVEHNWEEIANQLLAYDAPVVIDAGTTELNEQLERITNRTFLVLRPCYLALRKASNKMSHGYLRCDGIIVLEDLYVATYCLKLRRDFRATPMSVGWHRCFLRSPLCYWLIMI